jgi:hypothetical protein
MPDGNSTRDKTPDAKPFDDRNSAIGFTRDDLSPGLAPDADMVEGSVGVARDADVRRSQHAFVATDMRDQKAGKPAPHILANEEREWRLGRKR